MHLNNLFKYSEGFPERCLYIAVKAEKKSSDYFSGKYYFHSNHKNVGAYIQEQQNVPDFGSKQIFLVHSGKNWLITIDTVCCLFGGTGGVFQLSSQG